MLDSKKYEAPKGFTKIYQVLMKLPILQNIRIIFYFVDSIILFTIKKTKYKQGNKKRVLVIFPFALGDCVMFCGIARFLRTLYPPAEYELTITCQKANSVLFKTYFDKILPFNFTKSSVNIIYRRAVYREICKEYYDVVIDPTTCAYCTPNIFTARAALAKIKIGFFEASDKPVQCPKWIRRRIYTEVHYVSKKNLHRIEYYAEELRQLGVKECVATPASFMKKETDIELPEHFYVIFPAASLQVKMWPIERFAKIAKKIYRKRNIPLVLCGTEHDRIATELLKEMLPDIPITNLIGKTDIPDFIELVGRADFIITNDTSTYHIAMAQKVKTFLICGGYVFDTFANYRYEEYGYPNPILVYNERKCFNCDNFCKYSFRTIYPCIEDISVDDVWKKVDANI